MTEFKIELDKLALIIDTREKVNSNIISYFDKMGVKIIEKALNAGDYSFIYRDYDFSKIFAVERKNSLEELSGNLAQDRERFENELRRTKFLNFFMVLIENSGNGIADIKEQKYNTKFNPKSYIGTMLSYTIRYGVKFEFVPEKFFAEYLFQLIFYYLRERYLSLQK